MLDFLLLLEFLIIKSLLAGDILFGRSVAINDVLADLLDIAGLCPIWEFFFQLFLSELALLVDLGEEGCRFTCNKLLLFGQLPRFQQLSER